MDTATAERRLVVHGVTWRDYVVAREALDSPGLRMTFLRGALELMSPSRSHQLRKKTIARAVELYALMREVPLIGYGSTTFCREDRQLGVEPDECYRVGPPMGDGDLPDIVLDVIMTEPLVDRLEVYRGFGVPEVWLFQNERFSLHRLADDAYRPVERSGLLPDLEFMMIEEIAVREDQAAALVELHDRLGGGLLGDGLTARAGAADIRKVLKGIKEARS